MRMRIAALALAAVTSACAPAATTGAAPVSHNRDVVTPAELLATKATNLYDALQQIRPDYFRARGVSSIRLATPDLPAVYLDRNALEGLESLRNIDVNLVQEVRRLTPSEATVRLGRDFPGGVILVTTVKKP